MLCMIKVAEEIQQKSQNLSFPCGNDRGYIYTKSEKIELFTEKNTTLKTTIKKIQQIMQKLEDADTQIFTGGEPSNN